MKLVNKTALILNSALKSLDSYDKVVGDRTVRVPYKFSGKVRWNIAKNIRILDRVDGDITTARDGLIRQISGADSIPAIDQAPEADRQKIQDQHTEFSKKLNELLATEDEVHGILKIDLAGLDLDENPIPASTLSILTPLIREEAEAS